MTGEDERGKEEKQEGLNCGILRSHFFMKEGVQGKRMREEENSKGSWRYSGRSTLSKSERVIFYFFLNLRQIEKFCLFWPQRAPKVGKK